MQKHETKYFESRDSFRIWLKDNHDKSTGIWMKFFRKGKGTEGIKYNEALEEALCFGWIDSIIKKIDDEHYVRKFTPRTNISNWSDVNKKLVLGLMQQGRMTEAGLKKIDVYLKTGRVDWEIKQIKKVSEKKEIVIPDFILKAFAENEPALQNFNNLSRTDKGYFILWITSAKRDETILKRLNESAGLLKENKKLGLK